MAVILPENLELRTGDGEPFEREPDGSGWVNLDCYMPYIIDKPEDVPLFTNGETPINSRNHFMYQHIFFRENLYHQTFLPRPQRDRRYRAFREMSYSQVAMRSFMETQLHIDKEGDVVYPPEDTVENTLKDYFDLDLVGAAILGIHEIKNPRPIDTWRVGQVIPEELRSLTPEDRLGIFESKLQEAVRATELPRVIPQKIAVSALMRLSALLENSQLKQIASERLPEKGYYFPLRIPKIGTLRTIAGAIIREGANLKDLETARQEHQALQQEINLEQAA